MTHFCAAKWISCAHHWIRLWGKFHALRTRLHSIDDICINVVIWNFLHVVCKGWSSLLQLLSEYYTIFICIFNNAHGYGNELYYIHFHIKNESSLFQTSHTFDILLLYAMDYIISLIQWQNFRMCKSVFFNFNRISIILFELSEVLT